MDENPTSPRGIPKNLNDISWLLLHIKQQNYYPRNAANWLNKIKNTTAKILFEINFPTWFAYRFTRYTIFSNSHFKNKFKLKVKLH